MRDSILGVLGLCECVEMYSTDRFNFS